MGLSALSLLMVLAAPARAATDRAALSVSAYVVDSCTIHSDLPAGPHVACSRASPFTITHHTALDVAGMGSTTRTVITY